VRINVDLLNTIGLFCVVSGSFCGVLGAWYNSKKDDLESNLKGFKLWEYSNPTLGIYLIGLYIKIWQVDLGISLPILMYCAFMYTSRKGKKNCEEMIRIRSNALILKPDITGQ
jgi:hypothetical protein